MNTQQHDRGFNLNAFLAVLFISAVVAAIVLGAIAFNALGPLIGGLAVVGAIIVILAIIMVLIIRVASTPISRIISARLEMQKEANRHDEQYLAKGFIRDGAGYTQVLSIAAPVQQKQKVFDFNPNDIHTASVNYLLYSINLLGENGNRLASAPECAAATNLENYSARARDRIVKHLSAAYGVVTQPGPIENGGGTFVPEVYGTVGGLYHHVLLNSAVEALSENRR